MASSPTPLTPGARRPRILRRYHFRTRGLVYILVTVLVAVGAFNSQNNLLFWAFGFALATLMISGLISGAMMMGVEVERESADDAHAGDLCTIRYRVHNRNRIIPAFALTIEEHASPGTPSRFNIARLWQRRALPTGADGVNWPRHIQPPRAFLDHLAAGKSVVIVAHAKADRRGRAVLGAFRVFTSFPFGLIGKSREFRQPGSLIVRPALVPVSRDWADATDPFGSGGVASRRSGPGEEFFALREYAAGDSPRGVAWRASARRIGSGVAEATGATELLVRQNAAPSPVRLWVVPRLMLTAESEALDERAISLTASILARAASKNLDVGLIIPPTGSEHRPRAGALQLDRMMTDLATLDLAALHSGPATTGFPAAAAARGSRCIVVHSGTVDRGWGPERATHLSAQSLHSEELTPTERSGP